MDTITDVPKKPNILEGANFLSRLFFWWCTPLMRDGNKRELTNDDVCEPTCHHKSSNCGEIANKAWEDELKRSRRSGVQPQLLKVILRLYGRQYAVICVIIIIQETASFVQAYFLYLLLKHYSVPRESRTLDDALWPVIGIIACVCLKGWLQHYRALWASMYGLGAKLTVSLLLYQKVLRLGKTQKSHLSTGFIINLFAVDPKKLENFFQMIFYLVMGPVLLIASSIIMWFVIGWPAVAGIVFTVFCTPLQIWISRRCSITRHKVAEKADIRVRLMNEIISGIQVLKMYAWENAFEELIYAAREDELKSTREAMRCRTAGAIALNYRSRISIFLVLLSYFISRSHIDSSAVYIFMALFNVTNVAMSQFMTKAMISLGESVISLKRMTDFLLIEENDDGKSSNQINDKLGDIDDSQTEDGVAIRVEGLTATWSKDDVEPVLRYLNLDFPQGELTAVVGTVGAGKSSLLQAIMGEMTTLKGSLRVSGSISYAAQEPWVFQGSLRDNIVFGQEFNPERYNKVIQVCQLDRDIAMFPHSDLTIVGERGVMLSGGQKARVGLARAVYRNADTYLLDDPMSAVDVHVGKLIFDECIRGVLDGKTVILVTHQLQLLESVKRIVLLENGMVKSIGPLSDLDEIFHISSSQSGEENGKCSFTPENTDKVGTADPKDEKPSMALEHKMFGTISGTPWIYLKSGGSYWRIFLFFFVFVFTQIAASFYDFWQNEWVKVEDHFRQPFARTHNVSEGPQIVSISHVDSVAETNLTVLGSVLLVMVVSAVSEVFYYAHFCESASWTIHDKMFQGVIRTAMDFFNSNTSGRILNRFSNDLSTIDEILTEVLTDTLVVGLYLIGTLVMVVIVNPYIIAIIAVCCLLIAVLRVFYSRTSAQLKKLESSSRSPVIAHVNQTLNGLTTIRAFGAQSFLTSEFHKHQDHNAGAQFLFIGMHRTFAFWVECVGSIYTCIVVSSLLALDTGAANVGLALTQVLSMSSFLQYFMRLVVDLENSLISVERATEYANLPSEANWEPESAPGNDVGSTWPDEGKITFKDVSFRYQKNGPQVLENLNFTIMPREKVGIVGRTGAGKSSLISSLFRMAEVEGCIEIDDVDTSTISLKTLRSRISIIPQDPVLFSGTLRRNIDPFNQYSDDELWTALEEVELKEVVSSLPNGLDNEVSEGGGNLSVGQKQLVCLARAIVRKNIILVLDEATANVDHETDALIQKTIRRKFGDNTVLTVAHRIKTVMDSDKILVISNGRAVEFDHPSVLLRNEMGHFTEMVAACGNVDAFRTITEENYNQKNRNERQ